jgi:dTMP kinase
LRLSKFSYETAMPKNDAKFIVIDGIGGAGKTVVGVPAIVSYFEKQKRPIFYTREPGGLPEAEIIRQLIFDLKGKSLISAEHLSLKKNLD